MWQKILKHLKFSTWCLKYVIYTYNLKTVNLYNFKTYTSQNKSFIFYIFGKLLVCVLAMLYALYFQREKKEK